MSKCVLFFLLVFSVLFFNSEVFGQRVEIDGPAGSGDFGLRTVVLTNGNYVLADPFYDEGGVNDRGAVYLYNGLTHQVISTLKGSTTSDRVGYDIEPLANGNFVVISPDWNNGSVVDAGAVTWCDGTTGLNGLVSSTNSLVGSTNGDKIGYGTSNPADFENVIGLPNGNYVVISSIWNNGVNTVAGAVTFCSGTTGLVGNVSVTNSLVGSHTNDKVGNRGIKVLSNGNYVVSSIEWSGGGTFFVGAVTWGSGSAGVTGIVSSLNSFTGSVASDLLGSITPLSNGNYIISSTQCDINGITNSGAVVWANGATGIVGSISSLNCLYGTTANDGVGIVYALTNGNYVVVSSYFDKGGFIDAGAVTWADGTAASTGPISTSNSLTGLSTSDYIGQSGIVALPDGNNIVCSDSWDNGAIIDAGAVTWANGTTPLTGNVTTANSLVGATPNDKIGSQRATILSNGNYVIRSSNWGGNKGAVTWCDKSIPPIGIVTATNSLTGANTNDQLGNVVTALTNGNYVVGCRSWDNGAIVNVGSVTWCDGTMATTGQVTVTNSIVGTIANDNVGSLIVPLSNGHYVIASSQADINGVTDAGAVTWCNGTLPTTGTVSSTNSFIGTTTSDGIGTSVFPMPGGNYLIVSPLWDGINPNGAFTTNVSAITLCDGNATTTGTVTACNSVKGITSYSGPGRSTIAYNTIFQYPIISDTYDNKTTIFFSTEPSLSKHLEQVTRTVTAGTTVSFINNSCRLNTKLESMGASPAAGLITSYNWIEPSVPEYFNKPFVARHYQIQFNSGSPTTATGRLTLCFTQQEFTDFNNHPNSVLNLPANPTDAAGKANLRVGKYSGVSNDGSGLPASYTETKSVIDPDDNDIVWNATLSRWEVAFNVTGFSGFIVQTSEFVLPLDFLSFSAQKCNTGNVCLNWKTANEQNVAHFEIERSVDGVNYTVIGTVQAGGNNYNYEDRQPNWSSKNLYYRVKQVDNDNRSKRSTIAWLKGDNAGVQVYPTLVDNSFTVQNNTAQTMWLQLIDASGKMVLQQRLAAGTNVVTADKLTNGVYFYSIKNIEREIATGRIIKQ